LPSYPTQDGRWGTALGVVPPQALPVELSSFSASIVGNKVKLNWRTETEVNNYGFEIHRQAHTSTSLSVTAWEKIGFVNGNGNSNSPKSYFYEDKNVIGGKYSYRLKQIDNDGQFEYSKVIEVDLGAPKKFELSQNYPNPFNPITKIRFNLPEAGNVKLTLFNILGQELKTLVNEFKESGVYTINFDASNLNSGMYIYKLESGSFVQTRKMTLVK
ncbi:MAG TPA: T9SS type A sorting domain-containing protein, partial [Ignavibacteriaceae bacterium]